MSKSGEKCTVCQSNVPHYDGVFLTIEGNSRFHCNGCYNRRLSEMAEIQFDHPDFQPVTLKDSDGKPHEFQFTTRLLPNGISIQALEIQKGSPQGYQFQVMGPLEGDVLAIFGQLFERIRSGLSQKHLEKAKHGMLISDSNVVRGRIEWDDDTGGEIPLLIIDGKPITWEQLGRMLMTYEGFNFKLEIFDPFESR
ncbi:MAG: hypothetical protein HGB17_12855 [Syntrophobacteraceae bacterium]|nr:hypothetical protein [Syntrophobacteraceae bacterium]